MHLHRFFIILASLVIPLCSLKAQNEVQKTKPIEKSAADHVHPQSRIHFFNGDTLHGTPILVDEKDNLLFKSDTLHNTATFPIQNLVSLKLKSWEDRPHKDTLTRIVLQPRYRESEGDTLIGELQGLTQENVLLRTWYGGLITIKRSMVKSLDIFSNTKGNYYGPSSLHEWTLPDGTNTWAFKHGSLVSKDKGSIGKDIQLAEKSHVAFDINWQTTLNFKLRLYNSDVSKSSPNAYYEININRTNAYLQTRGKPSKQKKLLMRGGARWHPIQIQRDKKTARFDVFTDRKAGTITLFIDNKQACILQSQAPNPQDLGTGISFLSDARYPITLSSIRTQPWNGTTLPGANIALLAPPAPKDSPDSITPHKIILGNGDEISGTVGKIQNKHMLIDTEFASIEIPLKRIRSLSLEDTYEQPKKYRRDIRAHHSDGGFITLQLKSISNGKIIGFNQAMGNVSLDLAAFRHIDFAIYNEQVNQIRKTLQH